MTSQDQTQQTFYELFGGAPTFEKLVHRFYQGVAGDPELRALYPEEDLGPAEVRLRMFLEQYWGGPTSYSEQRGHPRLRMRHLPYAVTPDQRDRWLRHMRDALDEVALPAEQDQLFWDYLTRAAHAMVNSFDGVAPLDAQSQPGLGLTVRPES
ncbi:globin [Microlunatus elymi]|uniref:Globin n=1 Tax=Microlunatus elymi TaxID=2596828 RepID=A0A516PXH2_9ACTN|nr:globin [Microlunatus elymi]QDP95866.1 globin [Microlunatus elymi]